MTESVQLVRYDAMCRAIDAAYEVDEVKELRDKAMAIEAYAKQAKNTEAERRACEIRLRAERKAGQLLASLERAPRGGDHKSEQYQSGGVGRIDPSPYQQTLADSKIGDRTARRWQQLAGVPDEQFEAALAGPDKPTTNGIIERPKSCDPMNPKALWLWGRLRDFERDGILADDLGDLLSDMTDAMRADVLRLAPLVADWLYGVVSDE